MTSDAPAEPSDRRRDPVADAMLLLATAFWGTSFALAKEAGEAVNHANGTRALGPILTLAIRFTIAAAIVAAIQRLQVGDASGHEAGRSARPTRSDLISRGGTIGALLALGTVLQHLALERMSEAEAAFLTSLSILFVPLIWWVAFGRRPTVAAWTGVALAVPGVWLISGHAQLRIGTGEFLGVACAFVFAWHLLAVDRWAAGLGAVRACLAQFAMVAIVCWSAALAMIARLDAFDAHVLLTRPFVLNVVLLVVGPTIVSFGLMAAFQPRVTPVRALLIYLFEPVFASLFAWLWTGRVITRGEIAGGALILVANVIVEPRLWRRSIAR